LLTEGQWQNIELLVPKPRQHGRGGRPWIENRRFFSSLFLGSEALIELFLIAEVFTIMRSAHCPVTGFRMVETGMLGMFPCALPGKKRCAQSYAGLLHTSIPSCVSGAVATISQFDIGTWCIRISSRSIACWISR
jgi:hypothetical protein